MHISAKLIGLVLAVPLFASCTSISLKLTGTKGATYHGSYAYAGDRKPGNTWGTLPDHQITFALLPAWRYLEVTYCELRKDDTNALLRLELREHRYHVVALSPPGTSGVRLTLNGKGYDSEVLK